MCQYCSPLTEMRMSRPKPVAAADDPRFRLTPADLRELAAIRKRRAIPKPKAATPRAKADDPAGWLDDSSKVKTTPTANPSDGDLRPVRPWWMPVISDQHVRDCAAHYNTTPAMISKWIDQFENDPAIRREFGTSAESLRGFIYTMAREQRKASR